MTSHDSNRVLITTPSLQDKGGVASFFNGVLNHIPKNRTIPLEVGSSRKAGGILHPVVDQIRFYNAIIKARPALIHLNPSLISKSFFRDQYFCYPA